MMLHWDLGLVKIEVGGFILRKMRVVLDVV